MIQVLNFLRAAILGFMTSLHCPIVSNNRDNAVMSWIPRWRRAGNLKAKIFSVYYYYYYYYQTLPFPCLVKFII